MLRFLADENFNNDIVRGLVLRDPELDIVRVQDVGLEGATDCDVLDWAALDNRIVLTHDRATMSDFAYDRVTAGDAMPGVFILNARFPVRYAIEEIMLPVECSQPEEWRDRVIFLPL